MKTLAKILLLTIVSISIVGIELDIFDVISDLHNIEIIDFHEEGSGEKDSKESSEKDINIKVYYSSLSDLIPLSTEFKSSISNYDMNLEDQVLDIHLPPPEQTNN